ncbi:hypothetical protein [Paenibacillus thermotolerans]|uniref:hypothetical protein n=1 Tax=Paenibacillus thermotolerans TaxID=3027807 RepID=UPI002367B343|nr:MULTISPECIES: hypothetical protein [unclassified Paenibacillus]
MPLILEAFTDPTNTLVIADTGAPLGSLPAVPVFVPKDPEMPVIDGNSNYIFSPFDGPGETVTLQSVFTIPSNLLPIFTVGLPVTVNFAYAADQTATSTVSLQAINLLGVIVMDTTLFTISNLGDKQNVAIGSGDAVVSAALGPLQSLQVTVTTTVTAPLDAAYPLGTDGDYLGQVSVLTSPVV